MFRCGAKERLVVDLLLSPEYLPVVAKHCERFPETLPAPRRLVQVAGWYRGSSGSGCGLVFLVGIWLSQ